MTWAGDRLHKPSLGGNRITVVENRIAGVVRTELAKMTKQRPVFVVTPNSGDEEDANAAELAERVMRYLWRHLKMHEHALGALEWSRICGAGFLKCYWDSTVGGSVEVLLGPDGKLLTGPDGARVKPGSPEHQLALRVAADAGQPQSIRSKTVAQGDIRVEVRSPFQMFVDPICDKFTDAEWVIEESVKSVEYVYRRFGVRLKADTPANPGLIEARMMGASVLSGSSTYKGVKVREYWCKPSSEHPQGCRIVWSQNRVLKQDERPFDPCPYVMLTGVPVPGRLWPMSVVELLRGPQTELNKVLSQMAENRNRVGNPTILASKQAVQDPEKFLDSTTLPGGVYFFDDVGSPNAVPKYLEAPSLPDYVVEEPERIEKAIEDISGQHEVSQAQVPPGVTAASAITLLQETDDTRLGLAIQDYEEQLGRFGQKILDLVAHFYTDSRVMKLGGDDGGWEIFDFKGAMLRGNTHVQVQAGSALPQSQAAKQAMIKDLITLFTQTGNPPHGRQLAQFLRDVGLGASDHLIQEYTRNETQVNRENVLMSLGKALPINDYDDDQAHVDGHTDFQKAPRYQTFSPNVQRVFDLHVAAHRERLAQQQQQAIAMQAQAEGKPTPDQQAQQAQLDAVQQQQQLQGQVAQQQLQAAGQQQQMALKGQAQAQQQGFDQASSQQQQRQQEELHAQKLAHAEELHQHKMRVAEEQARQQVELARHRAQQAQQQRQGGQSARSK